MDFIEAWDQASTAIFRSMSGPNLEIFCESAISHYRLTCDIDDKSHVSHMSPLSQFLELVVFIRQYLCFRSVLLSTLSDIYSMSATRIL